MTRPKRQWVNTGVLLLLQVIFVRGSPTGLPNVPSLSLPFEIFDVGSSDIVLVEQQTPDFNNSSSTVDSALYAGTDNNSTLWTNLTLESEMNQTEDGSHLLPSSTPIIICTKEEVDTLAENVKALCSWISDIDVYVGKVLSRDIVTVPPVSDSRGYKDIIVHYNDHVKTSKDHCHSWRNEESIVDSLKNVVVIAQQFAPKFNHDLEETLQLVRHITEEHENINETETRIASLENDIREVNETALLTNVSSVLAYLEALIKQKEEEIDNITTVNQVTKARLELEALTSYLEGVRNYAAQIEMEAQAVLTRMEEFRDNTVQDAASLKRHRKAAQEGVRSITEEKENNNRELKNLQTEKDNLYRKIEGERAQIIQINAQIQNAQNELAVIEHNIARRIRKVKRKKKFGRIFQVVVPVVGWIAGHNIAKAAKREERDLMNQKIQYIQLHTQIVNNLQAQIAHGHQEIEHYQNRISENTARSRQLQEELEAFTKLDDHLLSIEEEADSILPFIARAVTSMGHMKDNYDLVKQDLQKVIETAKVAKSETEISNVKYFIYNEIDALKCQWEEAQEKIILVDQCH